MGIINTLKNLIVGEKEQVFISYRQEGNGALVNTLYKSLSEKFNVFLDKEKIKDGQWKDKITNELKSSKHFVLLLTKGALDRCSEPNDVLYYEIQSAFELGLHIVPVIVDSQSFCFPQDLPSDIRPIMRLQFSKLLTNDGEEIQNTYLKKLNERLLDSKQVTKEKYQNFVNEFLWNNDTLWNNDCSLERLIPLIDKGDEFAEFLFCWIIYDYFLEDDDTAVLSWLKKKESEGKAFAFLSLSRYEGDDKDIENKCDEYVEVAKEKYKREAENGNKYAQVIYASILGDYTTNFKKERDLWIDKATSQSFSFALCKKAQYAIDEDNYNLAEQLYQGITEYKEYFAQVLAKKNEYDESDEGIKFNKKLYKIAADHNYADAQYELAELYNEEKNYEESFVWYQKSAYQGNADAMTMLGRCYGEGWGTTKDEKLAEKWYEKAANNGNRVALYNQGMVYFNKDDYENAEKYWKRAVEKGYSNAVISLVDILRPQERYKEAFDLLKKHENSSAEILNQIGIFYFEGLGITRNIEESKKYFLKAFEKGDFHGAYNLAIINQENYKEYLKWLKIASDGGDADAQYEYGKALNNDKNYKESYKWFVQSANQGNEKAMNMVGRCYDEGWGVKKDDKLATEWYEKAAKAGDDTAMNNIAIVMSDAGNKEIASEWKKKAAENGNQAAQYDLAVNLYKEKKYDECIKYFKSAAEQGNYMSYYMLARIYQFGKGVEVDNKLAISYFEVAANNGLVIAQEELAELYDDLGDTNKAFQWYKKAAESGNDEAQNNLGLFYYEGTAVKENKEEAKKWFKKAALNNNRDAQYNFAACIENEDSTEAFKWYMKAAESGYLAAQYEVGQCYRDGVGTSINIQEAKKWFLKAAEGDYIDALCDLSCLYESENDYANYLKINQKLADLDVNMGKCNVAYIYYNGLGVAKNYKKAYEIYKELANEGDSLAQYRLGLCFLEGRGVDKDVDQAIQWLNDSAEQGNENAIELFKQLGA